jgi:hypothetical protein
MVRQDVSPPRSGLPIPSHPTSRKQAPALDRVLELLEQRGLSATELRVLLALLDRGAPLSDLAEALDQRPNEITRASRSLCIVREGSSFRDGARYASQTARALKFPASCLLAAAVRLHDQPPPA